MKCAKCGSEVPDRGKFCLECGARISGISSASSVEVDATLGNLQTMVRVPGAASLVGDAATMQAGAASDGEPGTSEGLSGEPLASRYEIVQQIGQGGFARVFGARDKRLDRTVAVKRLLVTD